MRHYSAEQWQCDHGAQYFTARDPAFAAVVDAWIDAGIAAPWQARIASWDGTQLRRSQSALMRYVGVSEMTAPARTLAAQLDVRLSAEVRALQRSRQGWRLSVSQDAAEHLFDTVLLAVPAPSAAGLLAQAAPALATIAEQVRMQPAWAVMAHFDAPIDPGYDALFVNAGALRWVACNSSKPARAGAETWLAHATAEWSQAHCDAMPGHVSASLVPELAALGLPVPQSCDAFFGRLPVATRHCSLAASGMRSWAWACAATGWPAARWRAHGRAQWHWPGACLPAMCCTALATDAVPGSAELKGSAMQVHTAVMAVVGACVAGDSSVFFGSKACPCAASARTRPCAPHHRASL